MYISFSVSSFLPSPLSLSYPWRVSVWRTSRLSHPTLTLTLTYPLDGYFNSSGISRFQFGGRRASLTLLSCLHFLYRLATISWQISMRKWMTHQILTVRTLSTHILRLIESQIATQLHIGRRSSGVATTILREWVLNSYPLQVSNLFHFSIVALIYSISFSNICRLWARIFRQRRHNFEETQSSWRKVGSRRRCTLLMDGNTGPLSWPRVSNSSSRWLGSRQKKIQ